jgi:hypothetical protein
MPHRNQYQILNNKYRFHKLGEYVVTVEQWFLRGNVVPANNAGLYERRAQVKVGLRLERRYSQR